MVTRRSFLAYTGGTALTLFAFDKFGIKQALAAIPAARWMRAEFRSSSHPC
jgi:hypothetical protein